MKAMCRFFGSQPVAPWLTPARPRFFLLLLVLTFVLRLPVFLHYPLNIDEAYYSVGAAQLASGGHFYRHVVDHKPPGIYLLYEAMYRLFGVYNQHAIHVALVIAVAATAFLVGRIARALFDDSAGTWTALLYAVASIVGPANDYQAANCELFLNLPAAGAVLVAATATPSSQWPRLLASGVLAGLAALVKLQGGFVLIPVAYLTLASRRVRGWSLAAAGAGALVPAAAVMALLWSGGALAEAGATLAYGKTYMRSLPASSQLVNAGLKTMLFGALDFWLVIPAALLMARGWRRDPRWAHGAGVVLCVWLGACCAGVAMGGRYYPHYYIQTIPPLAIMAARWFTTRTSA